MNAASIFNAWVDGEGFGCSDGFRVRDALNKDDGAGQREGMV